MRLWSEATLITVSAFCSYFEDEQGHMRLTQYLGCVGYHERATNNMPILIKKDMLDITDKIGSVVKRSRAAETRAILLNFVLSLFTHWPAFSIPTAEIDLLYQLLSSRWRLHVRPRSLFLASLTASHSPLATVHQMQIIPSFILSSFPSTNAYLV